MNILILGSSGLLGRNLYNFLKSYKQIKVYHNGLRVRKNNINNIYELKKLLLKSNPLLIINASGFTNIDTCEIKKKYSYKLNVDTVKNVFKLKKKLNLNFFFLQLYLDHQTNMH
jgi:dTDP-4-dehydrorhamnose reductase